MPVLSNNEDREGRLVIAGGQLAAVLVRLDGEEHEKGLRGRWFLEAGFGRCSRNIEPTFADLDEAQDWVRQQVEA